MSDGSRSNLSNGPPITHLLARAGDEAGRLALWNAVYAELHEMARRQLGGEALVRQDHATSLVHQVYLRLSAGNGQTWESRRHFFAAAANVMREIRVDDARMRKRLKRGGGRPAVPIEDVDERVEGLSGLFSDDPDDVLGVHELLDRYATVEPRKAEIVKLRFFAGMTVPEVAEVMDIAPRTVDSDWRIARAWLFRELSKD